ncbi:hypothetical protein B7486_11580 [cyanobacterium TDX16]|nr:hypothetical protein B7486_11580 [cyanobacterium TDX16]
MRTEDWKAIIEKIAILMPGDFGTLPASAPAFEKSTAIADRIGHFLPTEKHAKSSNLGSGSVEGPLRHCLSPPPFRRRER